MKKRIFTFILLIALGAVFFIAGRKYDEIRSHLNRLLDERPSFVTISTVSGMTGDGNLTDPEPEEPVYVVEPVEEGEYYALSECFSVEKPDAAKAITVYGYGAILPVTGIEKNTGWYQLEDGTYIEGCYVNLGRIKPLDTTMYVAKKCTIRKGPGDETEKFGKYETPGEEVHVTGQDIWTLWYQIDEEKYVDSANLIESRTEPLDEYLYSVKMCNVRKGPSTDYDKVAEINSGKQYHVIGRDIFTGWYQIDNLGYVGSSNLEKEIPTLATAKDNPKKIKYEWTTWYKRKKVTWSITVDKAIYEYYKGLKHIETYAYMEEYCKEAVNDYYVQVIAEGIKKMGKEQGLTMDQIAQEAVYFIQLIPYKTDQKSRKKEQWSKYVVETLYDNAGDCEDTAILTAGVLAKLGYKVALLDLPEHAAVAVAGGKSFSGTYYEHDGLKYYYVETTGEGWAIGAIPDEYKKTAATLYYLN